MAAKSDPRGRGLPPNETFTAADFELKHNDDEISVDSNFAAQNFWKEARIRFFQKRARCWASCSSSSSCCWPSLRPGDEQLHLLRPGSEPEKLRASRPGHRAVRHSGRQREDEHHHRNQGDQRLSGKRRNWTSTTGSAATSTAATSGPVHGRAPRVSLIIAVAAAIIDMVIGMSYGLISGLLWRKSGYADAALS